MRFTIENDPETITAKLVIDEEGDLALLINGIRVLYLSMSDGGVWGRYLSPPDAKRLQAAGFRIKDIGPESKALYCWWPGGQNED